MKENAIYPRAYCEVENKEQSKVHLFFQVAIAMKKIETGPLAKWLKPISFTL